MLHFQNFSKIMKINCAVYKPTGISSVALELIKGDKNLVGGGVRKSTRKTSTNSQFRIY